MPYTLVSLLSSSDYSFPACSLFLELLLGIAHWNIIENEEGRALVDSRVRPRTRWPTMNGYVSGVVELVTRYLPPRFTPCVLLPAVSSSRRIDFSPPIIIVARSTRACCFSLRARYTIFRHRLLYSSLLAGIYNALYATLTSSRDKFIARVNNVYNVSFYLVNSWKIYMSSTRRFA